mgnify:CR=1 FL=1
MELVISKLNSLARQLGGVYRVVGKYNDVAINCLAICVRTDDDFAEYITIKDYNACEFDCHGDVFRLDLTNYKNFTTFVKVKPNEIRCYPL